MASDSEITLRIQLLNQVIKNFPVANYIKDANKESLIAAMKEYISNIPLGIKEIENSKPIPVVVNERDFIWAPDLLMEYEDNSKIFVELKYTNKLLDYSRIKSSLASILELAEVREICVLGGVLVTMMPGINQIITHTISRLSIVPNVQIYKHEYNGNTSITVFRVDVNTKAPNDILDQAIGRYVRNQPHLQFRDVYIDNPWMRIIVSNIDGLPFENLTDQHL